MNMRSTFWDYKYITEWVCTGSINNIILKHKVTYIIFNYYYYQEPGLMFQTIRPGSW